MDFSLLWGGFFSRTSLEGTSGSRVSFRRLRGPYCGMHRRWLHFLPLHRIVGKPTMIVVAVQGPPVVSILHLRVILQDRSSDSSLSYGKPDCRAL